MEPDYEDQKLLKDELLNAKLFDNQSFQYILDRELQRRIKDINSKYQFLTLDKDLDL